MYVGVWKHSEIVEFTQNNTAIKISTLYQYIVNENRWHNLGLGNVDITGTQSLFCYVKRDESVCRSWERIDFWLFYDLRFADGCWRRILRPSLTNACSHGFIMSCNRARHFCFFLICSTEVRDNKQYTRKCPMNGCTSWLCGNTLDYSSTCKSLIVKVP